MGRPFDGAFAGRTVLVTGHTGFKGAWLTAWLRELGAKVVGLSLPEPPSEPCLYELVDGAEGIVDLRGDIRDAVLLRSVLAEHRPEIVLHLAAQALVLPSYTDPVTTFAANALGVVHVLDAVRSVSGVRSIVVVTTDKVYRNDRGTPHREGDRLGGSDPYSASKAMAELAVDAYRASFFPPHEHDRHGVALSSARAGNVVGGGDFAQHRLVPDCIRALVDGHSVQVRNPMHVRPWQHVLEPLSGYLLLAARQLRDGPALAEAWNLGPREEDGVTVQSVVERVLELWGTGTWTRSSGVESRETEVLRLDWSKAATRLGWRPVYDWRQALAETVEWYRAWAGGGDVGGLTRQQVRRYVESAAEAGLSWPQGL